MALTEEELKSNYKKELAKAFFERAKIDKFFESELIQIILEKMNFEKWCIEELGDWLGVLEEVEYTEEELRR